MKSGSIVNTDAGILLLRLVFGISLAFQHGWPTIRDWIKGMTDYPDPLGFGSELSMILMGFTELVCAIFIAVGFLTRISAIPLVIGFAIAVFVHHAGDPFGYKELALFYGTAFLTIFFTGPGKYSLDALLFSKKNPG